LGLAQTDAICNLRARVAAGKPLRLGRRIGKI
jgi:hypothetical protein